MLNTGACVYCPIYSLQKEEKINQKCGLWICDVLSHWDSEVHSSSLSTKLFLWNWPVKRGLLKDDCYIILLERCSQTGLLHQCGIQARNRAFCSDLKEQSFQPKFWGKIRVKRLFPLSGGSQAKFRILTVLLCLCLGRLLFSFNLVVAKNPERESGPKRMNCTSWAGTWW